MTVDHCFDRLQFESCKKTDQAFANLFLFQWALSIALAFLVTPSTWIGTESSLHLHVPAAFVIGGLLTLYPVYLARRHSGKFATRAVVAVAQMGYSALLIHLTGGRIETHFHVFGSLAFLAFYRDDRVLLIATAVTAVDHVVRGIWWPESVYGVIAASEWRWLEHAIWVLFTDFFLFFASRRGNQQLRDLAHRQVELEDVNTRIEETVRRRTEELAEARDAALNAAEAKAQFVANMSHEVRTPMNGILGFVEVLSETELDEQQREWLSIVRGSSESLLAILNDVLDFSKVESGKLVLEEIDFPVAELIEQVTSLMSSQAGTQCVELIADVETDFPVLAGDPVRLRQVLLNLVGNAIKFTEQGEVCVRCRVRPVEEGRARLSCEVRDTGIGIPQEKLADLFDAFTQADSSMTRRYGGTGLGLAISSQLVHAMGGELRVESNEGAGSRFWFEIELEVGQSNEAEEETSLDGTHVLIVDDNETNRLLLERILRERGATFLSVEGGVEALRVLERSVPGTFSIALLDYQMPELDGLELAGRIHEQKLALPMLLLTSAGLVLPEQWRAAGIRECLSKPIGRKRLLQAIHAVRDHAGRARPTQVDADETAAARERRVLVVDDNPVNLHLARTLLVKAGYVVDLAHDGSEAVDKANDVAYDLILMDAQMPGMDGLEATREIRAREGDVGRRVPIVAVTARTLPDDRRHCLEAGMDDHLAKPFRRKEFLATIERWCSSLAPENVGS